MLRRGGNDGINSNSKEEHDSDNNSAVDESNEVEESAGQELLQSQVRKINIKDEEEEETSEQTKKQDPFIPERKIGRGKKQDNKMTHQAKEEAWDMSLLASHVPEDGWGERW